MHGKLGRDLDKDTEVWLFEPSPYSGIHCLVDDYYGPVTPYYLNKRRLGIPNGNVQFPFQRTNLRYDEAYYLFMYDPKDGLWATQGVRKVWNDKPHLHPHYTLFQALYNILKN